MPCVGHREFKPMTCADPILFQPGQALLLLVVGNAGALPQPRLPMHEGRSRFLQKPCRRQLSGNFFAYHMNKLLERRLQTSSDVMTPSQTASLQDLGEDFLDAAKEAKEEKAHREPGAS